LKHEITRNSNIHILFNSNKDNYVEAEDLPAIQAVFSKYCDEEGLMTKDELGKVPPFAQMLVS
jgi:Ca2+-binding EF-hand superfamily protein